MTCILTRETPTGTVYLSSLWGPRDRLTPSGKPLWATGRPAARVFDSHDDAAAFRYVHSLFPSKIEPAVLPVSRR